MFEFFATRRSIRSERGVEVSIYGLTRSVADYQSFSNFSNTLSFFTFDCTFLGAFPDETVHWTDRTINLYGSCRYCTCVWIMCLEPTPQSWRKLKLRRKIQKCAPWTVNAFDRNKNARFSAEIWHSAIMRQLTKSRIVRWCENGLGTETLEIEKIDEDEVTRSWSFCAILGSQIKHYSFFGEC